MNLVAPSIDEYIAQHCKQETPLLQQLNRATYANVMLPQMLSGKAQGILLSLISKLVRPKSILEIGTYTGYSALCLAEGLPKDGRLITIDCNEELFDFTNAYFQQSNYYPQIEYIIGDAATVIPKLETTFDLVFIDADKQNYSTYFDLVIDKLNSNGIILADNVLWSGKVVEPKKDKDTHALHDFNQKVANDSRVENIILPLRDGINLIRKI